PENLWLILGAPAGAVRASRPDGAPQHPKHRSGMRGRAPCWCIRPATHPPPTCGRSPIGRLAAAVIGDGVGRSATDDRIDARSELAETKPAGRAKLDNEARPTL